MTLNNIGSGSNSIGWSFTGPSWITARSGTVAAGGTGTAAMTLVKANVTSTNIGELSGKLVPITVTGVKSTGVTGNSLDSTQAGLKGDFYHVPNADLSNLDTALSHANRKLVYSRIFPQIEFHVAGGTAMDALTEDDLFTSGTISVPVRRDFVAVFTGFIKITTQGSYTFSVTSDDGFRLKVNNTQVF